MYRDRVARVIAALLLVEAATSAMWIARAIPLLHIYGLLVVAFVIFRGAVAGLQGTAGAMILAGRPAAVLFGQRALLLSAGLLTFELGAAIRPTNVFPAWRWPIVGMYWLYALTAIWILERSGRRR